MTRITLLGAGLLAISAGANAENYNLDMNHSRIWFDVAHQGYSTMVGRFADFGGTIDFNADNPSASSVDITIDAASVDMFNDALNDHLTRSEPRIDFFGVDTYPNLRFVSTRVEETGENQYRVTGDFTMRGQTHPVSFDAILNRMGETQDGSSKVGFTATGSLDRTQFGMDFGAAMLGTDINFRIEIEAVAGT